VLSHVNLAIRAGEMVALVGMSGAGKSTLADLIPRFYDVSSGRIMLDGVDIRDLKLESLRAQVGIVAQHTFLFDDTVRNNIAYGDPHRPMDDIVAAAKAANAHEFVSAMPQGYDSTVGEMGMQLSGGQRDLGLSLTGSSEPGDNKRVRFIVFADQLQPLHLGQDGCDPISEHRIGHIDRQP